MRAIQATNPDIACSAPIRSIRSGIIRSINEIGFKPKIVGGAMVGLQATAIKQQLGPLLNGIINYETWVPAKTMEYPGVNEFLTKYQARAGAEGVDPLGYYLGTWGYAYVQLLGEAIKGANSLDDDKLADYFRKTHLQDHHGRREVRRAGRVGGVAPHLQCSTTASRGDGIESVQGHGGADHAAPRAVRDRQDDLPLREGEVVSYAEPLPGLFTGSGRRR